MDIWFDRFLAGAIFWLLPAILSFVLIRFVPVRWIGLMAMVTIVLVTGWIVMILAVAASNYSGGGPPLACELLLAWPLPFVVLLCVMIPTRPRRATSCECECGYDLTGNKSGTCPECGRATRGGANHTPD